MKGIVSGLVFLLSALLISGYSQTPVSYIRPSLVVPSTVPHVGNHDHLPAIIDDDLILLPGQIGDVRGYFVLDTGAPSLIVNSRLVAGTGHQINGQSVDGAQVALREVVVPKVIFRNREHRNVRSLALDLSHLEQYTQKEILGLLGREWLENQPFLFDVSQRHVLFLDKLAQKTNLAETITPFKNLEHIPVITVQVNGAKMHFGIDSGSARNLLNKKALSKLPPACTQVVDKIDLQTLSQQVHRTDIVSVSGLQLSPHVSPVTADFVVADMSSLHTAEGMELDGLIGLDFLGQYIFSIDYQKHKMYWWKLN